MRRRYMVDMVIKVGSLVTAESEKEALADLEKEIREALEPLMPVTEVATLAVSDEGEEE